jgi:2-dehydropantoate 2-reductase
MRICVFGAGAIGGNFAARLAAAGNDVSVVARGAHLEAIRANGLTLIAGDKKIVAKVRASDRPADLGPQDAVISTLKASRPGRPLAERRRPAARPRYAGRVRAERHSVVVRPRPVQGAAAAPDLSQLDPGGALGKGGRLHRTLAARSPRPITWPSRAWVVNRESRSQHAVRREIDDRPSQRGRRALARRSRAPGIGSPDTVDIRYERLAQADGQSHRLGGRPHPGPALDGPEDADRQPLCRRAHAEALAVAAAHGVVLDDSPDVRYGPKRVYFDHRPSILQDYDLGRPMEIESIVRAPVAFARSAGVATPTLDAIEAFAVAGRAKGLYTPDFFITVDVNSRA